MVTENEELDLNNDDVVVKDMAYYEANPDEMPTSGPEFDALFGETSDSEDASNDDEGIVIKDAEAEKAADDAAKKAEANNEPGDDGDKKLPVESKDGKHVLPYSVLSNTRDKLNSTSEELGTTKEALDASQGRVTELENIVKGYEEKADDALAEEKELYKDGKIPLTEDGKLDLEALRKDYDDDIVDAMEAMHKITEAALQKANKLSEQVERVVDNLELSEEQERVQEGIKVQSAIDAIPFMADIQSKGGEDWDTAQAIDKSLLVNPLWKDKPYEERFKEITRQMGGTVPNAGKSTEGDLDGRVNDALAGAKAKTPTSISDLEAGDFQDVDGIHDGSALSATQLEGQIADMDDDQLDTFLRTGTT